MADLFEVSYNNINLHIRNIFKNEELFESSVSKEFSDTINHGKRYINKLFNLDLTIAVVYRVNSKRVVTFRRWANSVLKEYFIKDTYRCQEGYKNVIITYNYIMIASKNNLENNVLFFKDLYDIIF